MVFAGIYPVDTEDYEELRYSMEKAPAKRRVIGVRAGELGRPWLWFPLRIPRHAPHGNRPGAVGAGVQHDGHHDGAQRELHLPPQEGRAHLHLTIPPSLPDPSKLNMWKNLHQGPGDHQSRIRGGHHELCASKNGASLRTKCT